MLQPMHFKGNSLTDNRREYFRLAEQFVHDYKFASKTEEKVWYLHATGYSLPRIAKTLNMKLWAVRYRIDKLRRIMLNENSSKAS